MYKRFGILLAIAAVLLVLITPGSLEALFALIFVGMVPLTDIIVPPSIMFIVYVILILLGIRWIASQLLFPDIKKRDRQLREKARAKVTKKVAYTQANAKGSKPRRSYQHAKAKA